jgi:II/X family phage/plasmid replication protein
MSVMIDWVTARVPLACEGLINDGEVVSLDADGVVDWRSPKRLQVEGSYSSRVAVRGGMGVVEFSGNPSKFCQGHNLFGSADLRPLMVLALERVAAWLGLTPSADDRRVWASGDYDLSRVDLARMVDCGPPERVRTVLEVLGQVARTRYQARSVVGSGTVYVGQHSRRVALKFYDKWAELQVRGHGLCSTLAPEWHQALVGFAAGKLRVELTLRSMELADRELRRARMWTERVAGSVLDDRLAVLELTDMVRLVDQVVADLPGRLVPVYDAWRAGRDLRALYSKRTFYRYRRQLLDLAGVDIARVQLRPVVTEAEYLGGFPIGPLLRGPGVGPPEWARGTELLAVS